MTDAQLIAQIARIARLALVAQLLETSDSTLDDAIQQIDEVTDGESLIELWERLT